MAADDDTLHTVPATFAGQSNRFGELLERLRAADRELGLAITMGNARDAAVHARAIQVYATTLVAALADHIRDTPATLPRTARRNEQRRTRNDRSADTSSAP